MIGNHLASGFVESRPRCTVRAVSRLASMLAALLVATTQVPANASTLESSVQQQVPANASTLQSSVQQQVLPAERAAILELLTQADAALVQSDFGLALSLSLQAMDRADRLTLPDHDLQVLSAQTLAGSALVQMGRAREGAVPLRAALAGWRMRGSVTEADLSGQITAGLNLTACLGILAREDPAVLDEAEAVLIETLGLIEQLAARRTSPSLLPGPDREPEQFTPVFSIPEAVSVPGHPVARL